MNELNVLLLFGSLVILAVLFAFCLIFPKKKLGAVRFTVRLCYIAVLSALAVVFNALTIPLSGSNFLSFVPLIEFIAGVLCGPIGGFVVGFIGDLICGILFPLGAYNPVIGIASGMLGFIPGFLFAYCKGNIYLKTVISFVLCFFIVTAGLNTFALYLIYGYGKKTFWAYLAVRVPFQLIGVAANLAVSLLLVRFLSRWSAERMHA